MNNKTTKQIMNSYRLKLVLVSLVYLIALGALIALTSYSVLLGLGGVVVLALSVRTPFEKIRETELERVIFDELDPCKFQELIDLGAFKNSKRHKVLCAVSLGEYEKALDIIENDQAKKVHPVDMCNDLYRKGYIYFEKGEFEKLPAIIKEYEALKKKYPQFAPTFNNFTVFDKFDAFADEDYEYVVDVCDIDLKEINPKAQNYKVTKINVGFYRAVSLYKLGKFDEAKEGFEAIIEFAPKMHKAKLAREYISLIEKA